MGDELYKMQVHMSTCVHVGTLKPVLCLPSSVYSVLLDPRVASVEQAEPRSAVPISHSTDCDSGLLEHLVQCRFLNGCWRDALLVC